MIETSLTENLEEALNFFQEMKLYRGQMENGQEEKTTQLEQQLGLFLRFIFIFFFFQKSKRNK